MSYEKSLQRKFMDAAIIFNSNPTELRRMALQKAKAEFEAVFCRPKTKELPMREYGKIESKYWQWARRKNLSVNAKLLSVYLLSSPHSNSIGCFELVIGYVMADFGWSEDETNQVFQELEKLGFAKRCLETDFVFIPDFINHNKPENINVGKNMAKTIAAIPREFTYWTDFIEVLKPYYKRFPDGFINGLAKGIATPNQTKPIQTEPEIDQVSNKEDIKTALDKYQSLADKISLPQVRSFTGQRRKKLSSIISKYKLEGWSEALSHVEKSTFLQGKNENGWKVDLDFLVRESSFVKVLEGKYNNTSATELKKTRML